MTFNLLCSICASPDHDPWDERLAYFGELFTRYDADLIGLQELSPPLRGSSEVEQILALAPGYEAVFWGPPGEIEFPDATLLYRVSRFDLVDRGDYWLSPTPEEPRSRGFSTGSVLPRLVVWARLADRHTGRELFVLNTHFDNNPPSQERSAELVMERTAAVVEELPVLALGDFNAKPSSAAYSVMVQDPGGVGFTFDNAFDLASDWRVETNVTPAPTYDLDERIDHIFVAGPGAWTVDEWVVDLTVYGPNDRLLSDHDAMIATLEY